MKSNTKAESPWKTVSEGLVKYVPSGTYFSYFRRNGEAPERKSLKTTDLATAKRLLAKRRLEAEKPQVETTSIGEAAKHYLKSIEHMSNSTQVRARVFCGKLTEKFGEKTDLAKLDETDFTDLLNERITGGGKKSSYNEDLRDAKKLLNLAIRKKLIAENPITHLKELRRDTPIRDTPTEEDFKAILLCLLNKETKLATDSCYFLQFMGMAGVGNSETAALQWKHVNFEKGTITLFRNKTGKGFEIPLFKSVRPLLEMLYGKSDKSPESKVFAVDSVYQIVEGVCKRRLKLPHFDQRAFRRMFIYRCIENGIPANVIGAWQGHADGGATILKNYADRINQQQHDRYAKLVN